MTTLSTRFTFFAALAALVVAAPAVAGGPLINCESGQPYLWGSGGANIPFNPDQGALGPLTNAEAVDAVQFSFDKWTAIPTATLSYTNAGPLPVDVDITNWVPYYFAPAPDGYSAIVFDDTGEIFELLFGPNSGVLGFAGPEWGFFPTCTITEGLAFLNGPTFGDLTAAVDVMVHEFGHYTNFAHTVVNGQLYVGLGDTTGPNPFDTFGPPIDPEANDIIETMYPFYFGPTVSFQTLAADDIAIASTMYPAPGFFAGTGTISGTIYAPDGLTRLTGVNVIARNVADPFVDAVSAISSDFTDSTSQADPVVGTYTINGLTPGAEYALYVDQIYIGGFSTALLKPLIGPEEFWNGADESAENPPDDPSVYEAIPVAAGSPVSGIDVIFNETRPGDPLVVGEDGFVELPLGFTYSVCGQEYNTVFVNANGNLTFASGDSDFTESAAEMLSDQPRIAALWSDLSPYNLETGIRQGLVTYFPGPNSFTVVFEDVPEYPNDGANSFTITLNRSSDHIDVVYGDLTATGGLAGVSCGGEITSRFEMESDLTALQEEADLDGGRINLQRSPALYEVFSDDNDLAYKTLLYNGTHDYNDRWAEPNDSFKFARRVRLPFDTIPVQRFSEIEPEGGDVDYYLFRARAGDILVAEVVTGSLDSLIGLFDQTGTLLDIDDDGGAGLLSKISYPIPANGYYYLAVTTFADFDFEGEGSSGGRYVLSLETVDALILDLGDDAFEQVPLGFTFPFNGSDYTSVFVNSNGNLTFGSGDTDFSESVSEFLDEAPRIAPLWVDLSPNQGGEVRVEFGAGSATVTFENVPQWLAGDSNNFAVTLNADGSYSMTYGLVEAGDGLAGATEGGGAGDPGETDLTAFGPYPKVGTTYELFSGDNDLSFETIDFNQ
jgi:hypothetical protein